MNMESKRDSRPTKRRDILIFIIALMAIGYVARDELIYFVKDKGAFLKFDSEYDDYLMAADQVTPLATAILDQCRKTQSCPPYPKGWDRNANGAGAFHGVMKYQAIPATPTAGSQHAETFQAFRITYDYRPGWRLVALGGIDTNLSMERVKRIQQ
jgi:hypothetical protein